MSVEGFDQEVDVLVVGSGMGGMTAALVAAGKGLEALVVEKTAKYGGSSALSGGGVWVPNNPVLVRAGLVDSLERARTYMQSVVGDRIPADRVEAFLTRGPEAIDWLERNTRDVRFRWVRGYADYHPEAPGGEPLGRTLEPVPVDLRRLGPDEETLNTNPLMKGPAGLWTTQSDYRFLTQALTTWKGRRTAVKVGVRTWWTKMTGRHMTALGAAGVARFRLALKAAGVPLWLESPLSGLILDGDAVVGARVERHGAEVRIRARRGVVLAAGGFERNAEMRQRYQQAPVNATWTSGAEGNTGDAILAGQEVGAAVDLMDDAWWFPSVEASGAGLMILAERSLPGCIVVNGQGERYVNEATAYVNFVHRMYEMDEPGVPTIPSYLILDQRYRDRYPFVAVPPRRPLPRYFDKYGIVTRADSLEELAGRLNLPPEKLAATVARFNAMAEAGRDEDFGKGESAYDRYYGDPGNKPNPCLAPLTKPPFYAFRIVPGDLGTKGGLVTDPDARVLRPDGTPIRGLYATGNTSASVMGNDYAGAGATIGPAIVFGYVAACRLAADTPVTV
ncbi:MAG: FAD-dependent oxidoreductase [Acidimicrobiales bacterium]